MVSMLTKLDLTNFRCFANHSVALQPLTILVGQNNAGKSTLVEALQLVSVVATRHEHLNFVRPPSWLDLPRATRGVSPSLRNLDIDLESVFHRYGDPPAEIRASFDTGSSITVFVGPHSEVFALIRDRKGRAVASRSEAAKANIPAVATLPHVAPVLKIEEGLLPEYVRANLGSPTSHLRFRNELALLPSEYTRFVRLAESSWPRLKVQSLVVDGKYPDSKVSLLIRDDNFVAEVSHMGHGLQMWLQTMWFLARTGTNSTVILDEPDIYMHADLQRRLIRLVRHRYRQTIIATHSVEIMADVEPDNILIVDKNRRRSTFASSLPAVQEVIEHIGGIHNIHLARLASARKCLLVEGKDVDFLRYFQSLCFPNSELPFDTIPTIPLGGWGGFHHAIGIAMLLKKTGEDRIRTYCLFDRDYHTDQDIQERYNKAEVHGIDLHIWSRKEIENYLLSSAAVGRIISGLSKFGAAPGAADIDMYLDSVVTSLEIETIEALANEIQRRERGLSLQTALQKARALVEPRWETPEGRLSLVSGKRVLSRLSEWAQASFAATVTPKRILRELRSAEIPPEMIKVVTAIEEGSSIATKRSGF